MDASDDLGVATDVAALRHMLNSMAAGGERESFPA
jgi:hypothetical protein